MKKRVVSIIMAVLLVIGFCGLLPGEVRAESEEFDTYLLDDETIGIDGYNGDLDTVVFPAQIDGYKVSKIGKAGREGYGFTIRGMGNVKKIGFAEGIKEIVAGAFHGCSELTEISFPMSIETIGGNAFRNCSSLKSVTLPSNIKYVDAYAFEGCCSLKTAMVDAETIDFKAFQNCTEMENVTLGSNVKEIGEGAFQGCIALKKVELPNGIKSIGSKLFYECSALESVVIPNSVKSIGWSAFDQTGLKNITVGPNVKEIGERAFGITEGKYGEEIPIPGFIVYGVTGSAADKYAKENNLMFSPLTEVAKPTFNYQTGTYTEPIRIEISSPTEGAVIHYTTDGSIPTVMSPVYTGAFEVAKTCTVSAIALKQGEYDSEVATAYYTIRDKKKTPNVKISLDKSAYKVGEQIDIEVETDSDGEWEISSADGQIVGFDDEGNGWANGVGTVTMTLFIPETDEYEAFEQTFVIKVKKGQANIITKKSFTKKVGQKFFIKAKTNSDGKITYKSSNTKVLTVNTKGYVTCKKAGTAYVIVKVANTKNYKGVTKKIKIKVTPVAKKTFPVERKGTYWSELIGANSYEYIKVNRISGNKVYVSAYESFIENARRVEQALFKNKTFEITGKNTAYNASIGIKITWSGNNELKVTGKNRYYLNGKFTK